MQLSERAEEGPLPGIPTQQAIDQASAGAHDLTGQAQKRIHECLELRAEDRLLFFLMTRDVPAWALGRPKREPGFQVPRQRGHHHVCPVTLQVIHRRGERAHATAVSIFIVLS